MVKRKTVEESDSMLERLRSERTDLNQREFAEAIGVHPRTYQRWVYGETAALATPTQVKAMCRVLGISIEELPDHFGPVHAKVTDSALSSPHPTPPQP